MVAIMSETNIDFLFRIPFCEIIIENVFLGFLFRQDNYKS